MVTPIIFWVLFNAFVLLMLALDLGVFHRKAQEVSLKEALIWTFVWLFLALIFNGITFNSHQLIRIYGCFVLEKPKRKL
jgi:tellurite resistance protein TerC